MPKQRKPNVWISRYRNGWVARLENGRPFGEGATQSAAIAFGSVIAARMGVRLIIQRRNGRIRLDEAPRRRRY